MLHEREISDGYALSERDLECVGAERQQGGVEMPNRERSKMAGRCPRE